MTKLNIVLVNRVLLLGILLVLTIGLVALVLANEKTKRYEQDLAEKHFIAFKFTVNNEQSTVQARIDPDHKYDIERWVLNNSTEEAITKINDDEYIVEVSAKKLEQVTQSIRTSNFLPKYQLQSLENANPDFELLVSENTTLEIFPLGVFKLKIDGKSYWGINMESRAGEIILE